MNDEYDAVLDGQAEPMAAKPPVSMPRIPAERMPPITSRFPSLSTYRPSGPSSCAGARCLGSEALRPDPATGARPEVTFRLERVAMEEVEEGLIVFELPEDTSSGEAAS